MEVEVIILIVVLALVVGVIIHYQIKNSKETAARKAALRADVEAARDKSVELDYHQTYRIAGINKYGLDPLADTGAFHGHVVREPDNPYDRHAVAVYMGNLRQVGYLKADDARYLSKDLDKIGGKCPCIMEIRSLFDEDEQRRFFAGDVQLQWPDTE
jgi:hypothetical protein